jgi:hypothetical protein
MLPPTDLDRLSPADLKSCALRRIGLHHTPFANASCGARGAADAARPRRRGDRITVALLRLLTAACWHDSDRSQCRVMSAAGESGPCLAFTQPGVSVATWLLSQLPVGATQSSGRFAPVIPGAARGYAARQWSGFFLSFRCRTRATRGWCLCVFAHSIASRCVLNVAST